MRNAMKTFLKSIRQHWFYVFMLLITLTFSDIPRLVTYPLVFLYREGQCQIIVGSFDANPGDPNYLEKATVVYRVFAADGKTYIASDYEWWSTDYSGPTQQYAFGNAAKIYTCWYNPLHPNWAVLNRSVDLGSFFSILCDALLYCLIFIPLSVWLYPRLSRQTARTRSNRHESDTTASVTENEQQGG